MKIKTIFAVLFFTIVSASCVIAAPKFEHYIFKYDRDHLYDIKLTDNTITWTSLNGDDKGQTETDYIKRKNLSNNIDVIQWSENDGTFVTVVFDRAHLNIISSGKFLADTWLWSGEVEVVQSK